MTQENSSEPNSPDPSTPDLSTPDLSTPDLSITRKRRRAIRRAGPPVGAEAAASEATAVRAEAVTVPPVSVPVVDLGKQEATEVPKQPRPWLRWALAAAAGIVVLGLVAATVVLGIAKHSADSRDAKRQEFIQAARQTVLNLTTIHPDTAKQDVERILANATGDFKAEFDGRIDPFVSVVEEAKVATDGQIIEAGLESENGDSANVLIAAKSMVTNSGTQEPQPRDFRLRVTITDEDGRMATSKVEFVP